MRRFSALVVFAALAAGAAALASLGACPPAPRKQADACRTAIDCYFGTDAAHDLSRKFSGLSNRDLFIGTYGENGSCWAGDDALAHSCEDRCRALLVQDCVASFNGDGGPPFCNVGVCDLKFAEECVDKATERSTCPGTSTPERGPDGGILTFDDGSPKFTPLKCSAPAPSDNHFGFGCCLEPGLSVDGGACVYQYPDPKDCREPAGNAAGICPKTP